MRTLLDVLLAAPDARTALILPETAARLTYGELRERVRAMAAGLRRGGRRARRPGGHRAARTALDAIVAFLAASLAGTAAPLNPAYRYEEFRFYLEDTDARRCSCARPRRRRGAARRRRPRHRRW